MEKLVKVFVLVTIGFLVAHLSFKACHMFAPVESDLPRHVIEDPKDR